MLKTRYPNPEFRIFRLSRSPPAVGLLPESELGEIGYFVQ
jgi:hypothetical protein